MDTGIVVGAIYFLLQAIIILLLGINIRNQNAMGRDIIKMTTWAEGHAKQDDERHDNEREAHRDLWSAVNTIKSRLRQPGRGGTGE